MSWFAEFFKKYKAPFFISIMIIVALLFLYFLPCYRSEIINKFFTLVVALTTTIVTAKFAIHKYHIEQRTLRLQKIYFEDTLLGQARSIEKIMSQTNNNTYLIENLFNLTKNVLDQENIDIGIIKNELTAIFKNTAKNIKLNIFITDFKKETISSILRNSGIKMNKLPSWLKKLEEDSYRFSAFLQSQILILQVLVNGLTEPNSYKENFLKKIYICRDYIQENLFLIKRHYTLFTLLSEITLEFVSENYTSMQEIYSAFRKEKILKIAQLINEIFEDVILDFKSSDIGKITKENAARLNERIECSWEKIAGELFTETLKVSSI